MRQVFTWMFPIYGALHFVPALLFKKKEWMKEPGRMILKTLVGTARSSSFLGVFVVIYQGICFGVPLPSPHFLITFYSAWLCGRNNLWDVMRRLSPEAFKSLPFLLALQRFLKSKAMFWIPGFLSGLSLFVEAPRRRPELAMYVMPKALESFWVVARGRGIVGAFEKGDALLCAIGMGMVMVRDFLER